jgi:hypothetical protein
MADWAWRENVNTVIAVTALVQAWVYWAWRKFFRRGTAEIFESGTIEIGYSDLGPTIGLQGTLHGRDREMFVRAVSTRVIREADNAQHSFDWLAFKSVRFVSTRPTEVAFQLPAGFLLLPSQPFRYSIVFNDTAFQQQYVQPVIDSLRASWFTAVQSSLGGAALSANPQQAQAQIQNASQAAYPAFSAQPPHVNAFTQLSQQFYWNSGWYKLAITIHTARPERVFTKSWRFELTPANSNALRLNSIKVIQQVCEQYIGAYSFANSPYQPAA